MIALGHKKRIKKCQIASKSVRKFQEVSKSDKNCQKLSKSVPRRDLGLTVKPVNSRFFFVVMFEK